MKRKIVSYHVIVGDLNGCNTTERFEKFDDALQRFGAWVWAKYEAHIVEYVIDTQTYAVEKTVLC